MRHNVLAEAGGPRLMPTRPVESSCHWHLMAGRAQHPLTDLR
jgi:hypothetical protein